MYESTRGNLHNQRSAQAIAWGMVPGGGLFIPSAFPSIDWKSLQGLSYSELAYKIMSVYLPDMPAEVIKTASDVYSKEVFDSDNPAPLVDMGNYGVLELWHGPTAAFKDMALQVLPHLLGGSLRSLNDDSEVLILVATSGDTGKAALEGFKNVKGTNIMVFYPKGGVSAVQERQMTSTEGNNTHVVAVEGNFDQCQTAVKEIFASRELNDKLKSKKMMFSSANSINWGRLLPQIVYYFWAYLQAVETNKIKPYEEMNVVVPTGNYGNLLAAYYAKHMGLPLGRIICASNKNNVLTDFFNTGTYQSIREFYLTASPSMDILISSNFERFLFDVCGRDAEKIRFWYQELAQKGSFTVDSETLEKSRKQVYAGWADEPEVFAAINEGYNKYNYLFDPHTAVAFKVYKDYVEATGDSNYSIIVSTASPFKFASNVVKAVIPSEVINDEWQALEMLSDKTGWKVPGGLKDLQYKSEQKPVTCGPKSIPEILETRFDL